MKMLLTKDSFEFCMTWLISPQAFHLAKSRVLYFPWLQCGAVCFLSNIGLRTQKINTDLGLCPHSSFMAWYMGSWASFSHVEYFLRKSRLWKVFFPQPLFCFLIGFGIDVMASYMTRKDLRKIPFNSNSSLTLQNSRIGKMSKTWKCQILIKGMRERDYADIARVRWCKHKGITS